MKKKYNIGKYILLISSVFFLSFIQTSILQADRNNENICTPTASQTSESEFAQTNNAGNGNDLPTGADEDLLVNLIQETSSSVVTIEMDKSAETVIKPENNGLLDVLSLFFNSSSTHGKKAQTSRNIGTGFIVTSNGLIVTNKHVVSDINASYTIKTKDNKKYTVSDIYRDPTKEIAVLRINSGDLKKINLGDSNNVKIGQTAIAIGTALGELENSVTVGIISGRSRDIVVEGSNGHEDHLTGMIQTDAAINFGNSGGPLINSSGEVIGVNTVTTLLGENIGFAIPINEVKEVLDDITRNGVI